jgi:hypothetical protein
MPAIHLVQLKQRTARLADLFGQPDHFVSELHKLLDFYADRTQRPGQSGEPPPLTPSFNVPKPVIRQIILDLNPVAANYPDDALNLSDALWMQPYFEFRYLATHLLSQLPISHIDRILERVVWWSDPLPEIRLLTALMDSGTQRLRTEAPEKLIGQIEVWFSDENLSRQKTGLNALIPLITFGDYDNLPVYYRLLAPFARNIPEDLRDDVRDAMLALARRSPIETAFFLGQYLETTDSQDTAWLSRQCMPYFPKESRDVLSRKLRTASSTASETVHHRL